MQVKSGDQAKTITLTVGAKDATDNSYVVKSSESEYYALWRSSRCRNWWVGIGRGSWSRHRRRLRQRRLETQRRKGAKAQGSGVDTFLFEVFSCDALAFQNEISTICQGRRLTGKHCRPILSVPWPELPAKSKRPRVVDHVTSIQPGDRSSSTSPHTCMKVRVRSSTVGPGFTPACF